MTTNERPPILPLGPQPVSLTLGTTIEEVAVARARYFLTQGEEGLKKAVAAIEAGALLAAMARTPPE